MASIPSSPRSDSTESFDTYLGSFEHYLRSFGEEHERRVDESDESANEHLNREPVQRYEPGPEFEQRGLIDNEPTVEQVSLIFESSLFLDLSSI